MLHWSVLAHGRQFVRHPTALWGGAGLLALLALWLALPTRAAELEDARTDFLAGRYAPSLAAAQAAVRETPSSEDWQLLLGENLLTVGRYADALQAVTNGLARLPRSIRLRWLAHEVLLQNGLTNAAAEVVNPIPQLVAGQTWAYRDPANLVVYGRAALLDGADPKRVLERVFDVARRAEPKSRDVHLATGELALDKHDFALAAKSFQEGLKQLPDDPDLLFGLARAYAPSDPKRMLEALEAALTHNSNHVGSLLLLTDHAIDCEDYAAAREFLDRARKVNPGHPDAGAFAAVMATLENQPDAAREARATALQSWPANPRVDHLIGTKLSQKYRFREGAAHQREALRFDPDYLPAKAQLAQDLLRLGQETEGWSLADEVQRRDAYDVAANNLITLRGVIAGFRTLTNQHFALRMSPKEAAVYGPRALELLERAREQLGAKYRHTPAAPVLVEVFPEGKDFAVRTFGMPDHDGFLGVCFGSVITANSPAARAGRPFNWEAMLWHEYCHVVTLQLTHNKMPRWLSEGISVYEERQANPAWGERLGPRYREMLLGDELTPVSELSGAFLAPPTAEHLQFAYYQSSLVVEFLVGKFGQDKLTAILQDLGNGADINAALERHTLPMAELEKQFTAFAHATAAGLAPGLDWEKPDLEALLSADGANAWETWARARPTNYWVMTRQAAELVQAGEWTNALPLLERLTQLYPAATGAQGGLRLLATTQRALGNAAAERQALTRLAECDDEAVDAYARLLELTEAAEDWPAVALNAQRYLAVNPMVPLPYRYLARAAEATGDWAGGIAACRALLELEPANPAELHFTLARLLHRTGDPAARREVLLALEDAPRHRPALELLLALNAPPPPTGAPPPAANAEAKP